MNFFALAELPDLVDLITRRQRYSYHSEESPEVSLTSSLRQRQVLDAGIVEV